MGGGRERGREKEKTVREKEKERQKGGGGVDRKREESRSSQGSSAEQLAQLRLLHFVCFTTQSTIQNGLLKTRLFM